MRRDCETKTLVVVHETKTRIFTNWWITDVGTKINLSCWRRKLLCRLVMQPWILLYVWSDVGRMNRLWPGCDLHLELINYNWSGASDDKLVIRLVSTRHIPTAGSWCLRHKSLTVEFGGRCCSGYFCMFCLDTSLTFTSSDCWSRDADGWVADFCLCSRSSASFPAFICWVHVVYVSSYLGLSVNMPGTQRKLSLDTKSGRLGENPSSSGSSISTADNMPSFPG